MSTASRRVEPTQRFDRAHPCPVCGGCDDDPRGQGGRCYGFLSDDRLWAHCTREDHAGSAKFNPKSECYAHHLKGPCACGTEHGPADPKPSRARKSRGIIDQVYAYTDAAGSLLFEVVRFMDPKGFAQRVPHPTHKDVFTWGLKGVEPVLFNLRALAASPGKGIIVVEGEKDVRALEKLGILATTSPMGAGKWRDAYSKNIAGRPVVIIPDNDKAGRDHAEAVARSVYPVAKSVKILILEGLPPGGDVSDWLARGGAVEELRRLAVAAPAWHPVRVFDGEGGAGEAAKPPEIEVNHEWHRVVEEAIAALANDHDLYRRGEALVTVCQEAADTVRLTGRTAMSNALGSPRVVDLSDANIGCRLTRQASLFQWKKSKSGEDETVDARPPDWLLKAIATRRYWPGIRNLAAVAECPFPRPDGSLVETPGYDDATQTLYLPTIDFPRAPESPTRDDARSAWQRLRRYACEFPFGSEDDEAVYLAGQLVVIARPAIPGPVPGIAVVGNKAGTGKGLLIDAMSLPAIGRPAPTTIYPEDPIEAGKVKVAIALSGKPVVHFDNLDEGSSYGNSSIDSAMTATTIDDRVLGASRNTGEVAMRVSWFLSGNNVFPGKDAHRRWLVVNLVTDQEHPEERSDIRETDLRGAMLDARGEIVRDALTILRAHAQAGWPNGDWAPMGSFEQWDRVVRGAVWFATGRDCLATQRKVAAESPDRQAKIALLEGWREMVDGRDGAKGVTTADAVKAAVDHPEIYPTLHGALLRYGSNGKLAASKSIGNILRGLKMTPIDGLRLEDAGQKCRAVLWRVARTDSNRPDNQNGKGTTNSAHESEESSESDSNPRTRDFGSHTDVITLPNNMKRDWDGCGRPSSDSSDSCLSDPDEDREVGTL